MSLDGASWSRPSPFRKAWCELTGGHDNELAYSIINGRTDGVSLFCKRCGKQTKFYKLKPTNEEPP